MPYLAGMRYTPRDQTVAILGTALRATLRVRKPAPGLLLYKLCVDADGLMEAATLAILLRYIVRGINQQRGRGVFRPVDLSPALNRELSEVARALGLTMTAVGAGLVAKVTWRHFWKAVVKRFFVRGATALTLSAADGPLPVGELLAAGLALWTIVDVIRLSDEIWRDAGTIAAQDA